MAKHRITQTTSGTLSSVTPTVVGGRRPIPLKFALEVTHSPFERNDFDQYPLMVPQPWELAKNIQLALVGSRPRAFQRAIDEPYTLPLSLPKGDTKRSFAVFASKIQLLSEEVC